MYVCIYMYIHLYYVYIYTYTLSSLLVMLIVGFCRDARYAYTSYTFNICTQSLLIYMHIHKYPCTRTYIYTHTYIHTYTYITCACRAFDDPVAAGAEGGADGEGIGGGRGGGMLNAVWEGWSGVCAGAHGVWLAVLERYIF
jgi:hypothetical protein